MEMTYRVCIDCAHYVANGELPEASPGIDPAVIRDADPEGVWTIHTDPEPGFSWSACHRCESTLGGDRFHAERAEADGVPDTERRAAVIYNAETGEIINARAMTSLGAVVTLLRFSPVPARWTPRHVWRCRSVLATIRTGHVGESVTVPGLGFPITL